MGDYPKLKPSSGDSRCGHIDWDIMEMKRNFNEPLSVDYDMTAENRYDDTTRFRYSQGEYFIMFLKCASTILVPLALSEYFNLYYFAPVSAQQRWNDGKEHYTFELE